MGKHCTKFLCRSLMTTIRNSSSSSLFQVQVFDFNLVFRQRWQHYKSCDRSGHCSGIKPVSSGIKPVKIALISRHRWSRRVDDRSQVRKRFFLFMNNTFLIPYSHLQAFRMLIRHRGRHTFVSSRCTPVRDLVVVAVVRQPVSLHPIRMQNSCRYLSSDQACWDGKCADPYAEDVGEG